VHVLPFYVPYDGADAGFDPVDHLTVDPRLGTWADVGRLGASRDLLADLVVNHVSDRSEQFRDVVERGDTSPHAGMFLTYDRVFPQGATEADLVRVVRPRPGLPFRPLVLGGRSRLVWTTFSSRQIDLDVRHPAARRYLSQVLHRLAASGVAVVRLDAVGYTVKTAGTSCFLTPETMRFVDDLTAEARRLGMAVLAEVHAPDRYVAATSSHVDRVYDFVLAPLVLHALFTGDVEPLRAWLVERPANAVTVLDSHDGLGFVDVGPSADRAGGRLTDTQVDRLVAAIAHNSGGTSRASFVRGRVYRVGCTLYDAVGRDDRAFLLARLLQLVVPGIPQVYYVGLLAGSNDPGAAARSGDDRELNRRRYTGAEVDAALRRPVVRQLTELIRIRTTHPAFTGEFRLLPATPEGELGLAWRAGTTGAELRARMRDASFRLTLTDGGATREISN
jgi:sucrose phosphorylase